jgi:transposase InsO family protein
LRSQAEALLAADFIETVTLTGARLYILAVIEHTSGRIRVLGATPRPTAAWMTQAARNLVMDLQDAGSNARYLIWDRDGKYTALFDEILADAGIRIVRSGVQMPRMNAITERWVRSCRRELLDRAPNRSPAAGTTGYVAAGRHGGLAVTRLLCRPRSVESPPWIAPGTVFTLTPWRRPG